MGEFCRLLMLTSDKHKISMKRCWSDRPGKMTTQLKPWHLRSSSCLTFTELCCRCYLRCNDSEKAYIHFSEFTTKEWRGSIIYPTCSQSKHPKLGYLSSPRSSRKLLLSSGYPSQPHHQQRGQSQRPGLHSNFSLFLKRHIHWIRLSNQFCVSNLSTSMLLYSQKPRQKGRTSPT